MGRSATPLHDRVREVTERIRDRSAATRADCLAGVAAGPGQGVARERLACTNLAHGIAAAEVADRDALKRLRYPNVGIVSAYNDMLSAHQPFERYETQRRYQPRAQRVGWMLTLGPSY